MTHEYANDSLAHV